MDRFLSYINHGFLITVLTSEKKGRLGASIEKGTRGKQRNAKSRLYGP